MIITTVDQIRKIIPNLDANVDFDIFETYIESAEHFLENEIVGSTIYDIVDTGSPETELKNSCERVIATYAYYEAIPSLDVVQTNNGLAIISNSNLSPASQHRRDALMKSTKERRDREIEALIQYLRNSTTYYPDWQDSDAFARIFSALLYSERDFSSYIPLDDNRELYLKIRPAIKTVQDDILAYYISKDYVDELITKQKEKTFTEWDQKILQRVKHALALLSLSRALEMLMINISDTGIFRNRGNNDEYISDKMRKIVKNDYWYLGIDLLDKVATYMDANIENYTTYENSDVYARKIEEYQGYTNESDESLFIGP